MNLTNKKIESHKIQHRNSSCLLTRSHPPSPALEPQSAATIKIQSPESGYCQGYTQTGMGHSELRLHAQKKVLTIKS